MPLDALCLSSLTRELDARLAGADAVLVGEALMRSPDRGAMIRAFREIPPADLSKEPGA